MPPLSPTPHPHVPGDERCCTSHTNSVETDDLPLGPGLALVRGRIPVPERRRQNTRASLEWDPAAHHSFGWRPANPKCRNARVVRSSVRLSCLRSAHRNITGAVRSSTRGTVTCHPTTCASLPPIRRLGPCVVSVTRPVRPPIPALGAPRRAVGEVFGALPGARSRRAPGCLQWLLVDGLTFCGSVPRGFGPNAERRVPLGRLLRLIL